jgi:hypothetical protein
MLRGKNLSQEFRRKCLFNEDSAGKIGASNNIKKMICIIHYGNSPFYIGNKNGRLAPVV